MIRVYAILAIIAAAVAFYAYHRHVVAKVATLEASLASVSGELKREREQSESKDKASEGFQNEIARLRSVIDASLVPVGVGAVRLCRTAPTPRVPVPAPGAGPDAPAGTGGGISRADDENPEASRDLGPDLFRLAGDADDCSAQVRGLQDFVRRMHDGLL